MDSFTLNKVEFHEVRRILSRFARCSLGKEFALRVGPSRNPDTVRRWLKQTTQMVQAVSTVGLPPFGGITDVTAALNRAQPGGGAGPEDFIAIASTLEGAGSVRAFLDALPEELDELHALAAGVGKFDAEILAIHSVIGQDGAVRDDASDRLAGLRRDIAETSRRIHDVMYGYLQNPEVSKLLQNTTVTLHGDRYVLPLRQENRGRLPGVVHRESNTGSTVFVEPQVSVELNNRLTDLRSDERREVERLLHQLAVRLLPRQVEMHNTLRGLAQVDLLTAKAQYAYQFDMICPETPDQGPLVLHQARHPLLIEQSSTGLKPVPTEQDGAGLKSAPTEQGGEGRKPVSAPPPVVPIDVRLGQDFDLLVITGSNTGGKTVAMKTVALLALMSQSGLCVPAQHGSVLPVFRDIFLDVGDEQSLQQSLSTFGAHIKRVRFILNKADKASLVLLDELGSGTDPDEGGAIGQAVLDELRRIGCLGMITTHLSVLKAYAMTQERVDNAAVEFDTETLRPTYRLCIGQPGESHAITVAQKLGLGKRIIGAARHYRDDTGKQFRRAIRITGQARMVAEQARAEAHTAQVAAEDQQQTYQSKLAELHRIQGDFENWLAGLPEMKPGDEIHVPSMNRTGRLVRLELHRQVAVVDMDNLQMEVPLRELMPNLGQNEIRQEIADLRKRIVDQAAQTEQARAEADRMRDEYHRSLMQQRERARQFDTWLGAIARVKIGDEVPIAKRPGKGKVTKIDLPGLRATVSVPAAPTGADGKAGQSNANPAAKPADRPAGQSTDQPAGAVTAQPTGQTNGWQEIELSIQDLFPQTGPFTPAQPRHDGPPGRHGQHHHHPGQQHQQGQHEQHHEEPNLPVQHRSPDSKVAKANRDVLINLPAGAEVYVVPFHKRAAVIRMLPDKDQAVVQSGIFEMTIAIADLEPVHGKS